MSSNLKKSEEDTFEGNNSQNKLCLQFKDYRIIRSDRYNIDLQKNELVHERKNLVKTGQVRKKWITLGHHSTLRHALIALVDEVSADGHQSIDEVMVALKEVMQWIDGKIYDFRAFERSNRGDKE